MDKNIIFTRDGNYYFSNEIPVETSGLNSVPSIKFYGAPTSTSIYNNELVKDGEGTLQIRIPVSSLYNFDEDDFELYMIGYTNGNEIFEYSNYGAQKAIYGRQYSTQTKSVEASIPVYIKGVTPTKVNFELLDDDNDFISGIKFNIYKGDCSGSTCKSSDLVTSFTTSTTYTTLNNKLESGIYTIVRKSNNSKYDIPEKTVITIEDTKTLQTITILEGSDNTIGSNKFVIYNSFDNSNNIIYIYSSNGTLVKSYKSSYTTYSVSLSEGDYYIIDSKNKIDELHFKVTNDGTLMVKYNDEYTTEKNIDLDKIGDSTVSDTTNNNSNSDSNNDSDIIVDTNTSTNNNSSSSTSTTVGGVTIENKVDVDVKVDWISNIIDCPITSVSSTIKYILGAIVLVLGACFVFINVKKSKNNN